MYLELVEWELNQTRKDENIFELWKFCDLLYNAMIKYNWTHCKYAGEVNTRPATQQNQSTRKLKAAKNGCHQKRRFNGTNLKTNQGGHVFPRYKLISVWESHTIIHALKVTRNSKEAWQSVQGLWEGGLLQVLHRCSISAFYGQQRPSSRTDLGTCMVMGG